MPDTRAHRGRHPEDAALFSAAALPPLRAACGDLCWLLSRGYAGDSALKLVGDRYALHARQRIAVARCTCSADAQALRRRRQQPLAAIAGQAVDLDGYNVLTTVEAALAGGVLLLAQDGCCRDMASRHGTYRAVSETLPAITLIGQTLNAHGAGKCTWYLDRPVSNSGRLKQRLLEAATVAGWTWEVHLVDDPDRVLIDSRHVVASADSRVLDGGARWVNLARDIVELHVPQAWIVDLSMADVSPTERGGACPITDLRRGPPVA